MQRNCTYYEKPTNTNTAYLSKLRLAAKYSHNELLKFCNFLKRTTRPKRGIALMPTLSTKTTVNPHVLAILTTKITAYPALKKTRPRYSGFAASFGNARCLLVYLFLSFCFCTAKSKCLHSYKLTIDWNWEQDFQKREENDIFYRNWTSCDKNR